MKRRLTWSSCLAGIRVQHGNLPLQYETSMASLKVMAWCKRCRTDTLYHYRGLKQNDVVEIKIESRELVHLHLFWSWSSPVLGHTHRFTLKAPWKPSIISPSFPFNQSSRLGPIKDSLRKSGLCTELPCSSEESYIIFYKWIGYVILMQSNLV